MQTLTYDMALTELQQERIYTLAQLQAHPLTQSLTAPFMALETRHQAVASRETTLLGQHFLASARVDVAGLGLGLFIDQLVHDVLKTVNNDRGSLLYQRFFDKRPSELKRLAVGEQMTLLRPWSMTLASLPQTALQQRGDDLDAALTQADEALQAESAAQGALSDFREVGERKAFVDEFNAMRKDTFGKLAVMVHAHPEYNLSRDFPEQFFLRERRPRAPTIEGVQQTIDRLERDLARQQELLATLLQQRDQEEQARIDAAKALAAQELLMIEAEAQKAMARAAELKAILNK